jgi:PIN domain nuclease of toxin-antitoxin system
VKLSSYQKDPDDEKEAITEEFKIITNDKLFSRYNV